jgi:hypothetical protein
LRIWDVDTGKVRLGLRILAGGRHSPDGRTPRLRTKRRSPSRSRDRQRDMSFATTAAWAALA